MNARAVSEPVTDAELRAIVGRIFRDRRSTLQAEGAPIGSARLSTSIALLRADMCTVASALPGAAFERCEHPLPGEAGWTAGQIVSHNADRLLWVLSEAQSTLGDGIVPALPSALLAGASEPPLTLAPADALEVVAAAEDYLSRALPTLMDAVQGQLASSTHHGEMGLPGWLLLIAIHDHDHLGQLLARTARQGKREGHYA
jgi:hypothetical protein